MGGAEGLSAVTERIGALTKERRPGIIAIDSFKALAAFAEDAQAFRSSFTTSPHCSRPSP